MKDFWKALKVILYCLYFSPLVIGLLMIATGNGTDSSKTEEQPSYPTYPSSNQLYYSSPSNYVPPIQTHSHSVTPDDAYDEGYEAGYEQGKSDGSNGESHGYGYDDSTDYYDYYETKYQEGYEEGYDVGFSEGESEYQEEQEKNMVEDEDYY